MNIAVMIPTYNESQNIVPLITDILSIRPDISIIVVDDNSPDGTSDIVGGLAKSDARINLITRKNEKGRGTAGIRGFKFALEKGYDIILEMDSDYSHHPRYIPVFLEEIKYYDVVIGSRNIEGGKDIGRGFDRQLITKFANMYIRLIMGLDIKDCTSGYRCFRRYVLEGINLDNMISTGPSIVEEILYRCKKMNFAIKEIPVIFEDRKRGESTKDIRQYIDTAWKIFRFRFGF